MLYVLMTKIITSDSYTSYPEYITLALIIYLGDGTRCSESPRGNNFTGWFEIPLGGIRTATEAEIHGSTGHDCQVIIDELYKELEIDTSTGIPPCNIVDCSLSDQIRVVQSSLFQVRSYIDKLSNVIENRFLSNKRSITSFRYNMKRYINILVSTIHRICTISVNICSALFHFPKRIYDLWD